MTSERPRLQFGLGSLFWLALTASLVMGYLRQFGSVDAIGRGLLVTCVAIAIGAVVGFLFNQLPNSVFWSTTIAIAAYLSVVRDRAYGVDFYWAWSLVGALTGTVVGAIEKPRSLRIAAPLRNTPLL